MLRSLFSGISGMRTHQQMMDVTGNNIANVNTAGFKSSQAIFEDTLSQMLQAAGAPQNGNGGTNPAQVGLGVRMAGISTNFGQGATQNTGRATDLAISGDGFFVVNNGTENVYTRAGAFLFDANGNLVTSSGAKVQGWVANATGAVNTNGQLQEVTLGTGIMLPRATTTASFVGNLPGDTADGTEITTSIGVYDAQGVESQLSLTLRKQAAPAPAWDISYDGGATYPGDEIDFATSPATITLPNAPAGVTVNLSGLTNYAGESTLTPGTQDGWAMGSLAAYSISPDGTVTGSYTNGYKQDIARIAMATFNNPNGLEKAGGSAFRTSVNSGEPEIGIAGSGGRGVLQGGSLEMSNVDLGQEFTNLVIAQRGFQANSRVISTSDELLQELVNLKR